MNKSFDIQYLNSQQETLIKWIKSMPMSQKKCIRNILSIDSGNGRLDKQVIELLPNIKNYYIIQSDYNNYQNCIKNLFGNFKFKLSYSDLFDYELDPYLSYDVIVFFDGINDIDECSSFIKQCIKFINEKGKLWIFTHEDKGCLNSIKSCMNLKTIGDKSLKNSLDDIKCRIFNTHIPTFININKLNCTNLSQILRKKCDDNDLDQFKIIAKENYGDFISIPISVIILSNFIIDKSYEI
jgi:hypothetical protein